MTKYARIVIEKEIKDDASEEEILHIMEITLQCLMTGIRGMKDIGIHEKPYKDTL